MDIQEIIKNFKPVAVKFNSTKDCVLVTDTNSKISLWVDVWKEGEDISWDWNQYIFTTTDKNDMLIKALQENIYIAISVSELVMEYFENNQ